MKKDKRSGDTLSISARYNRTKRGKIIKMFHKQRYSTKHSNLPPMEYTQNELYVWLINKPEYHRLFDIWEMSGFNPALAPSLDRINDYKGYSFNNIQLVTWGHNNTKGCLSRKTGENNKMSKGVIQYSNVLVPLNRFYSIADASRKTNIDKATISRCCSGIYNSAGGFIWRYDSIRDRNTLKSENL